MLHGYRQLYYLYQIEDVYEDIANDVEKRFDTSNYEVNRQSSTRKNKKMV